MRATLSLLFLLAGICPPAQGQCVPVPFPTLSVEHFAMEAEPVPGRSTSSRLMEKKDHTVTGLLIGAALGMAAGWAFYNAMCEAVDNNCADSRVRLVLFGGAAGGALGALIGSISE